MRDTVDEGDGGWRNIHIGEGFFKSVRHFEVLRPRKTVGNNRGFQRDDGAVFGQSVGYFFGEFDDCHGRAPQLEPTAATASTTRFQNFPRSSSVATWVRSGTPPRP